MAKLSDAIVRDNRDKRTAIEEGKRLLRGVSGRDGDERQVNVEIGGRWWWVGFKLEDRRWRLIAAERWRGKF